MRERDSRCCSRGMLAVCTSTDGRPQSASRGMRANVIRSYIGLSNETPVVKASLVHAGIDDRGDTVWNVVTWLILPVVICLSQRLSHACLSITTFVLGNCEWLIKSVIVYLMVPCYMDNCGNSRANTCNQAPTSGRGVFIR
jgi:hypothetical protein